VTLRADIGLELGTLALDADIEVEPGELVAVLGPNGAGKSTLLRCVAGLLAVDRGSITIDGETVDAPPDVFVPAERRSIGVVFQDYLLFAHLSALENVAFGLRASGTAKSDARRAAAGWLERVGLGEHASQRPGALSGGQQQRVALARALAREPRVLLLDEPLAALDAGARGEVRRDLRRHLDSFEGMRLMVTHDPIDAYALADRVVVLERGTITQRGSLADVTARPRSDYVAELAGLNLLAGRLDGAVLTTERGGHVVTSHPIGDGPAFVAVRPRAISLHRRQPEGSPRNVWQLVVGDIDRHQDWVRVRLDGGVSLVAEVTPAAVAELDVRPGEAIWASVKAVDVDCYAR
jgi:molybdate transport system ATP-binding protein